VVGRAFGRRYHRSTRAASGEGRRWQLSARPLGG
jgi:hypothetical protein